MDLYSYNDYKDCLRVQIKAHSGIRGYQSQLAAAAGCQRAYISQVVRGSSHLTLEQASRIAGFWSLSEEEADYFLNLVLLSRAGTSDLRDRISRRLNKLRSEKSKLPESYKKSRQLTLLGQVQYYASWYQAAIHVLLSMKDFSTPQALSQRLQIPVSLVERCLDELKQVGVVEKKGPHWRRTEADLFLPKDSPMTSMNHLNWRQRAWIDVQNPSPISFHYTALHAMSHEDLERFQSLIKRFIADTKALVEPSTEEEAICFTCDFFKI